MTVMSMADTLQPTKTKAKVDALFNSLHFERIHLTNEYKEGTPEEIRMTVQERD